ncbi:MAG: glycoside hydrolase family 18 protein [Lentisphaerae bacterium]|nr:glycoside hydrolase family 18 protein [Lentisphaerota bacterium]MCP4101499.1 glycoside hydrolase family 18 protein [Lentisphaerota bacterium]
MLKKSLLLLTAIMSLALTVTSASASTANKKIVAYYPEWAVYEGHNQYTPADIPWDKVTHINYAFATIDSATNKIKVFDDWAATGIAEQFGEPWDSEYKGCLGQFKKLKADHPNTKTMISIGGWSQSAYFHQVSATAEARKTFADSVVEFIRQWDFDGVDIDWEYPTFQREPDKTDNPNDHGTPYADETETETFTLLMKDLRAALDQAGQEDSKYYELTAAIGAGKDKLEKIQLAELTKYLDFFNVMTYDFTGAFDSITGLQSALKPNPEDPRSDLIKNYYNIQAAVQIILDAGVPAEKIIIGSPYYSRGWKEVQEDGPIPDLPGLFATANGGPKGIWDGGVNAGNNPYYYIKEKMETNPSFKKYRDPYSQAPYLYSKEKKEMYTYEDEVSLKVKTDYVLDNNLGGIIFWELTGDSPSKGDSLTSVIYNAFYSSR